MIPGATPRYSQGASAEWKKKKRVSNTPGLQTYAINNLVHKFMRSAEARFDASASELSRGAFSFSSSSDTRFVGITGPSREEKGNKKSAALPRTRNDFL